MKTKVIHSPLSIRSNARKDECRESVIMKCFSKKCSRDNEYKTITHNEIGLQDPEDMHPKIELSDSWQTVVPLPCPGMKISLSAEVCNKTPSMATPA